MMKRYQQSGGEYKELGLFFKKLQLLPECLKKIHKGETTGK